ncbi:hypothetical protein NL676_010429 [Syzygium grande]|nr:hypothetical protein NL676_010429 [Syzygium grande]
MQDPSLFSPASCCCLFSLLALLATTHLTMSANTMDVVNLTCEKCSQESPVFNYTFCSLSLQAVPLDCLRDCLELYSDASKTLVGAIGALMVGKYGVASMGVSAAMEAATTCEDGFEERGEVCALTEENYDLFQLCDIALCIIRLLSLSVAF